MFKFNLFKFGKFSRYHLLTEPAHLWCTKFYHIHMIIKGSVCMTNINFKLVPHVPWIVSNIAGIYTHTHSFSQTSVLDKRESEACSKIFDMSPVHLLMFWVLGFTIHWLHKHIGKLTTQHFLAPRDEWFQQHTANISFQLNHVAFAKQCRDFVVWYIMPSCYYHRYSKLWRA